MKKIVIGYLTVPSFYIGGHWEEWKSMAKKAKKKDRILTVFALPIMEGEMFTYPDLVLQIQNLIKNYNPSHYEVESKHTGNT